MLATNTPLVDRPRGQVSSQVPFLPLRVGGMRWVTTIQLQIQRILGRLRRGIRCWRSSAVTPEALANAAARSPQKARTSPWPPPSSGRVVDAGRFNHWQAPGRRSARAWPILIAGPSCLLAASASQVGDRTSGTPCGPPAWRCGHRPGGSLMPSQSGRPTSRNQKAIGLFLFRLAGTGLLLRTPTLAAWRRSLRSCSRCRGRHPDQADVAGPWCQP